LKKCNKKAPKQKIYISIKRIKIEFDIKINWNQMLKDEIKNKIQLGNR
jgi:hypothetical protein